MSAAGEAIAGVGVAISTYYTRKKIKNSRKSQNRLDIKAEVDEEMAKARELAEIKTNLQWIMRQLGESPNGGGIMQQVKEHIAETKENFAEIRADQRTHLEWHLEANK